MELSRQEYWTGLPFPFSRGSSWPRDRTQVSHIAARFFTVQAARKAPQVQSLFWTWYVSSNFSINMLNEVLRAFKGLWQGIRYTWMREPARKFMKMPRHVCPDLGPVNLNSEQLQHRAVATWYIWWLTAPQLFPRNVQKKEPAAWSHERQHLRSTAVCLWQRQCRGAQAPSKVPPPPPPPATV